MLEQSSERFNWFCICSPSLVDLRFDLSSFASLMLDLFRSLLTAVGFHHIHVLRNSVIAPVFLDLLTLFISSCGSIT